GIPRRQAEPSAAAHARLPLAQAALRSPLPEGLPAIGLGPFPIHAVIATAGTVVGWLVVRTRARRLPDAAAACPQRVAVWLFVDAVLVGLLRPLGRAAARLRRPIAPCVGLIRVKAPRQAIAHTPVSIRRSLAPPGP